MPGWVTGVCAIAWGVGNSGNVPVCDGGGKWGGERLWLCMMGEGGVGFPQVDAIESDAHFILLVEKDAAFMRLAEDRFYNTYPCIILTAKGQPDVATRCG